MRDAILIVDDEPGVIAALKRVLLEEPYDVLAAAGGEEGLTLLKREAGRIKVVLSDERMPGMPGAAFLAVVREYYPDTVRIILTGHASIESMMKAVNSGEIYRFLTKPWDDMDLRLAVRAAVEKSNLEEENRRLLRTVRRQAQDLKALEERHPGITRTERAARGRLILPEVSEEEIARIITDSSREPV
jgi:two-component system, probable response regulator PhcQ